MGKYDEVIRTLDRLPVEYKEGGQKYQDRIDEEKIRFSNHATPSALTAEYASLRADRAAIEESLSKTNLSIAACEQLMEKAFEDEGISSMKTSLGSIRSQSEPYPVISNREEFRDWCNSDPDLRQQMTLNHMTAKALVKERLLQGQDTPPGVSAFVKTTFVWTPVKK
jgi:hypothetical protein